MELTRDEQALLDAGKRHFPFPELGGWYSEEEFDAITRVLRESMDWRVGFHGPEIGQFEREFAAYCGVKHAIAVNSCGTGLDAAMQSLELGPDDEVIVPAITYMATALSVVGVGARVVLAEIDPATFNIDPNDVERKMSPRTRAIMPVHNNGLSADMDALIEIAERHPHPRHGAVPVIGDAARACGGGYKGTKVGKRGAMNIFSFQTTKNMTTLGEGGMVTTDDDDFAKFVRSASSFGWGLKQWGSNYRMTRLQGVAGSIQLKRLDAMNEARRERVADFSALLQGVPGLTLPAEPHGYDHVWYGYTLLLDNAWAGVPRDRLVERLLKEYGVDSWIMNKSLGDYDSILIKLGHSADDTPVSTNAGRRLFCPALHPLMTDDDLRYIVAAIKATMASVAHELGLLAIA
jgi:dTDP-4-amino-4,6-dideoxygalactose transaminase